MRIEKKLALVLMLAGGVLCSPLQAMDKMDGMPGMATPTTTVAGSKAPVVKKAMLKKSAKKTRVIKKSAGSPVSSTVAKEVWVCPMGEFTGDKPGKCPKCGMDLVLKK